MIVEDNILQIWKIAENIYLDEHDNMPEDQPNATNINKLELPRALHGSV